MKCNLPVGAFLFVSFVAVAGAQAVTAEDSLIRAMIDVGVEGEVLGHQVEYAIENVRCSFNAVGSRCSMVAEQSAEGGANTTQRAAMNLGGEGAGTLTRALLKLGARTTERRNGSLISLSKVTCATATDDQPAAPVRCVLNEALSK